MTSSMWNKSINDVSIPGSTLSRVFHFRVLGRAKRSDTLLVYVCLCLDLSRFIDFFAFVNFMHVSTVALIYLKWNIKCGFLLLMSFSMEGESPRNRLYTYRNCNCGKTSAVTPLFLDKYMFLRDFLRKKTWNYENLIDFSVIFGPFSDFSMSITTMFFCLKGNTDF